MNKNETLKTILLIFVSFAFSFNLGNAVHEFGHAISDNIAGIPWSNIHVIIHPFLAPHMSIYGGIPDSLMGWPDAAGPLADVVVGLVVFAILWQIRRPYLLPFLFWGPLACVQEGFGQIVNISQTGTDAARMVAAGFPAFALILISSLLLITGIVLFVMLVPVSGVSTESRLLKLLLVLVAGMLPYGLIMLLVNSVSCAPQSDISRSINVTAGFFLIAILVSILFTPVNRIMHRFISHKEYQVSWYSVFITTGLLIITILLELLFLN